MRIITIGFSNMWGEDAAFTADYLYRVFPFLRNEYELRVTENPDYVFFSVYGYVSAVKYHAARRILISGECGDHFTEGGKLAPGLLQPGFYHYGLTCAADNKHSNHIFLPQPLIMLNLYNSGWQSLVRTRSSPPHKEYFCDFIYGNPYSDDRREFMRMLSEYKRVECAGPVDRNTDVLARLPSYDGAGYRWKQEFQARCKFSIAFENNYFPGYTTEKLSDPLVARSVPIYSGNPRVAEIFNPNSFINVDSFESYAEAIEYIKYVDNTPGVYQDYLNEPPFRQNRVPDRYSDETYLKFFRRIFNG